MDTIQMCIIVEQYYVHTMEYYAALIHYSNTAPHNRWISFTNNVEQKKANTICIQRKIIYAVRSPDNGHPGGIGGRGMSNWKQGLRVSWGISHVFSWFG